MALNLDHTIVPVKDKEDSVRFMARILGLEYKGPWGHFAPLQINDILTLDFDNQENFDGHHYALIASDEEFDAILGRIKGESVSFGSRHFAQDDGEINHNHQGRGFYFRDTNGHSWEIITHTYITGTKFD